MAGLEEFEVWFVTGSQHLYGDRVLQQVADHSIKIAAALDDAPQIPVKVVFKTILTRPQEVTELCVEANSAGKCIGLICWMHTFSPAKMWINGLKKLNKPIVHLHTQFNRDLPWDSIDMDYMNLHQSAHGGREFGFIGSRMKIKRKVVVGHWMDDDVKNDVGIWIRAACGWHEMQTLKIARFGDNMREVAVTEGDKVEAQMKFGFSVNGYGMGDLVEHIDTVSDSEIDLLVKEYADLYELMPVLKAGGERHSALREAAKIELGLRGFLQKGNFHGFTDTFENLHGLEQLPGIAVQRLMHDGYGFGAEGDWKTAALVRAMKTMATGLPGGNSFMEDYTYHLHSKGRLVLGAHMLEICTSIASGKPSCEIHPLRIGGKADPVRLVFDSAGGPALNASVIDMGNRFRLLVNKVEAVKPKDGLPNLPVARVLWNPLPELKTAAAAWILAGGAHHTCFSQNLTIEHMEDFSEMADVELVVIDENTRLRRFKQDLRWNETYYK